MNDIYKYIDKKYYLVVLESYNKQIPEVIKDYVISLNIIYEIIHLNDLINYLGKDDSMFIMIQLILNENFFLSEREVHKIILNSNQIIFINVEMVTEQWRAQRIINILKYSNFIYGDYSAENINLIKLKCKEDNIHYTNKIIHLPYQFNIRENLVLQNLDNKYNYDVGIINACVSRSKTVNPKLIHKRNLFWETIQKEKDIKVVNIMGWENKRDEIIKRCKIIVNIHHFTCFKIHESIRCDRLVFAKKIIVSEPSIFPDYVDTKNYIIYEDYENILQKVKSVLKDFNTYSKNLQNSDLFPIIKERKQTLLKNLINI